jgi:hypothetical protein
LQRVGTGVCECPFLAFYKGQPPFDEVPDYLRGAGFKLTAGAISSQTRRAWEQGDFVFEREPDAAARPHSQAAA